MWGIKLVYTPDRSRQEHLLAQIKERRKREFERESERKEKKNANATN
jgi:hypothetical protein